MTKSGPSRTHYRSQLFKQLTDAGVQDLKPYRESSVEYLKQKLEEAGITPVQPEEHAEAPTRRQGPPPGVFREEPELREERAPYMADKPDPLEMPGQRLNTHAPEDVIRVDEQGRFWHQEEVLKPSYPKPRGRRVLKYMDTGVRTETVKNGEYVETFEVAGNEASRPAEVKITLPSYQVGIYTDPRFPFKIYCYDGREGFDFDGVNEYFGGSELIPDTCKRVYIENVLCYDIRSVIRTIQAEYRHLQLTGKI